MELVFLFVLLLVIVFISRNLYSLFYVFKPKSSAEKLQLPPGSTGWPFIGETIEYHSMARKNCIENFLSDRLNKYSSKLFKTSYIGETMVFMCSAEGNKFLFSNENKLVKSWWPSSIDKILAHSDELNRSKQIRRLRKQMSALFTGHEALENNLGIIDAVTKEHLQTYWNSKEVKVGPLAKKLVFALACRFVLSLQDSETLEELEQLFNCIRAGLFSLPINIPGTNLNRAIRASKGIRQKFEALIKQRKIEVLEKLKPDQSKDMLSLLLKNYDDVQNMNESDVASIVLAFTLTAYDSVSSTMVSIVKYLAELPQVYKTVYNEQMEIANSKGPEELLNLGDLKRMKISWNVAREVLRLQPPSQGTFREAITTFSYDGFQIPKGWKLHSAAHATHKNPKYFPDPEKFDPSRFEGNEIVPFSYIPFGGGPHICPGREYARLQILIFMHNLVKRFKREKVIPDEQMIRDPALMPANGLPIRLHPHELCHLK